MRAGARQVLSVVPVVGASGQIYELPTDTTYQALKVRLDGQYTNGAGADANLWGSPFTFLRRLEVNLGGGSPLLSSDGAFWKFWNAYTRGAGTPNRFTAPTLTNLAVSQFFAELTLDFRRRDLIPPWDTAFFLDAHDLAALNLIADFGAAADIGATGNGTFQNLKLTVTSEEWQDVRGQGSREQITRRSFPIAATGDMAPGLGIQTRGPAYRAFVLRFTSGNADPLRATNAGGGDDTICDSLSIVTDQGVRLKDYEPYSSIQAMNVADSYWQGTWPTGVIVVDFNRDKTLRDLLLTNQRASLTIIPHIAAAPANSFVQLYTVNDLLVLKQQAPARIVRSVIRR